MQKKQKKQVMVMLDMSKLELSEKDRNQLQILDELISHEKSFCI